MALVKAMQLGTRLSASLVQPLHHMFAVSELDYDTMLKIALSHWIRKAKDVATPVYLCDILKDAGTHEAGNFLWQLHSALPCSIFLSISPRPWETSIGGRKFQCENYDREEWC